MAQVLQPRQQFLHINSVFATERIDVQNLAGVGTAGVPSPNEAGIAGAGKNSVGTHAQCGTDVLAGGIVTNEFIAACNQRRDLAHVAVNAEQTRLWVRRIEVRKAQRLRGESSCRRPRQHVAAARGFFVAEAHVEQHSGVRLLQQAQHQLCLEIPLHALAHVAAHPEIEGDDAPGAAVGLLGVVMVDGFADADQFKASVAKLDSLGIPTYQIAGPPSASNAWGRTTDLLAQLHPGQFVGIETPLGAHAAAITASVGWINDIYAGYGPTNPQFGIYGNPNDGTYVAGQRFTIAGVSVTVLYATTSATPTNMALIAAGSFEMGNALSASNDGDTDELPVHTVSVREFYMDKYEVSKSLWDEVASWAGSHGYDINTGSASGKATNHPVYNVTWHEAVKWSNARSQKEGLTPCYTLDGTVVMRTGTSDPECNFLANGYRLPTEAEWEKAARGGLRGKRFPWGDTITHSEANYESSSYSYDVSPTSGYHPTYATGSFPYSSPVGSFPPNAYGLYEVAGNMDEWCWDSYSLSYYATSPELNPTGPALGDDRGRVRRGGSWTSSARYARAADRDVLNPDIGYDYLGFRCVRSSDP